MCATCATSTWGDASHAWPRPGFWAPRLPGDTARGRGAAPALRARGRGVELLVGPGLGTAEPRFPALGAQFGGHAACRAVAFPPRVLWLKTPPPARAHAPAKDPKKPPTRAQRGRGSLPASRSLARRRIEGGEALQPCARLRSPQRRLDEAWSWRGLRKASSERPWWRRLLLFAELLPKRQAFTRNERRSRPGQVPQSFQKRFPGSYPKGSARLLLPSPGTGAPKGAALHKGTPLPPTFRISAV